MLRGIEHRLDHTFDLAVGGRQGADIHAEPLGNRGAHLRTIERLAFDLARLKHRPLSGFAEWPRPEAWKPSASMRQPGGLADDV